MAPLANPRDDELPITYQTIPLGASHPPGFCVQNLFYQSDSWIPVLRQDVSQLLDAFVLEFSLGLGAGTLGQSVLGWTENGNGSASGSTSEGANGKGKGKEGESSGAAIESPFQVFKKCWINMGWSRIHLLGAADGPMKKPWAESVSRAFLEYIHEGEYPLKQVGALFGIYIFWGSQAPTQETIHISIDPPTLEYILKIPTTLAPCLTPSTTTFDASSLDPLLSSTSQSSASQPSLDLASVVISLISTSAFFIVPTENYLHPDLPNVTVEDTSVGPREETAKLALAVDAELDRLAYGPSSLPLASVKKVENVEEEGGGGAGEEDYEMNEVDFGESWMGSLSQTRSKYLEAKSQDFSISSTSTLQQNFISQAEARTFTALKAAAPTAPGADGIMSKLDGKDAARLKLLHVVESEEKDDGGEKGLESYREILGDLRTLS